MENPDVNVADAQQLSEDPPPAEETGRTGSLRFQRERERDPLAGSTREMETGWEPV